MKLAAISLIVAALLGCGLLNSSAETATQEKCTCDAQSSDSGVQDNGAVIENATACWSSVDEKLQWCAMSVQALEGDQRHETIIQELITVENDPPNLVGYLQKLANDAFSTADDQPSTNVAKTKAELPAVIKEFDKLATACALLWVLQQYIGGAIGELGAVTAKLCVITHSQAVNLFTGISTMSADVHKVI